MRRLVARSALAVRGIPRWQVAIAFLPLLLALGQLGYLSSQPIHALVGVVIGGVVGAAGVVLNLRLVHRSWSGAKLALAMIGTLVLCFVVVELIGTILGALYPAQLGSS